MAGAATRRQQWEFRLVYYIVARENYSVGSGLHHASAKVPTCFPPTTTYWDNCPLPYSTSIMLWDHLVFSKNDSVCEGCNSTYFLGTRCPRSIFALCQGLPPGHAISECIPASLKHHPTLKPNIYVMGRLQ